MANLINIRMPDGTIMRNVPDNTSREDIQAAYEQLSGKKLTPSQQEKPTDDATFLGEAGKAVQRGFQSTGALFVEGLPAVFKAGAEQIFGGDFGGEEQTKKLVDALNYISNNPELKAAVGDWEDVKDPKTAALFLANAAQAIPDMFGGLGAGLVAKTALKSLGKRAAGAGFVGGLAGYNQAVLTPSEQASIYAETGEVAPGIALGSAAVQNLLETGSDLVLAGKLGKAIKGRSPSAIGKAAVEGAATEGATEFAQGLISEGAQEVANPEKATFTAPINEAILGAAFGGAMKGTTQLVTGATGTDTPEKVDQKKIEDLRTQFEEEVDAAPEQQLTPPQPQQPVSTPESTALVQQQQQLEVGMDERPLPPVEAYEADLPTKASKKPINTELMKQTSLDLPVAQQKAVSDAPRFNLFSNVENEKIKGYVQKSLDLIGFDEDVVLIDLKKLEQNKDNPQYDASFLPAELADRWFNPVEGDSSNKSIRGKVLEARMGSRGLAGTVSKGLSRPIHYIGINPDEIHSESDIPRTLAHEAGHVIVNRFIERSPELKSAFVNGWKQRLTDMGVDVEGVSDEDIAREISSWSFNKMGEYNPETLRGLPPRTKITSPFMRGSNSITERGYKTAFDEYMAENITRWYQSNDEAVSILDKFFKAIADLYRSFLGRAKQEGLMPAKDVDNFMNNLVQKAKAARVAEQYREAPEFGLQELRAYHGSPYRFVKFLLDRIGTGEGAQVFGWGLYFTDSKAIADWYKKKLSGELDTKVLQDKNGEKYTWKQFQDYAQVQGILPIEKGPERTNVLWDLNLAFFNLTGSTKDVVLEGGKDAKKYKELIQKLGFTKPPKSEGAVYEVQIPEEKDMIPWYTPINTEILNKFPVELLRLMPVNPNNKERAYKSSGQDFYEALVEKLGSPKEASLYLNSLGIKGIKYRAGTYSGINSDSTNYVIFDDAAIEITQVFDEDEQFAQLKAQEDNKAEDTKQSPFRGYQVAPKLTEAVKQPLNFRTKGIIQGFIRNFNKPDLGSRTNAVQQYIVIQDALTDGGIDNTYYPEVFRGLIKNTSAVPDTVRNVMNNETFLKRILDGLKDYYNISKRDLGKMTPTAAQAEAFRLYALRNKLKDIGGEEFKKADTFVSNLPPAVNKSFEFMDALRKQLKQDLRDNAGITQLQDVVNGAVNNTPPSIESLMEEINFVRNQADKETLENRGLGEAFASDEIYNMGDKRNTIGGSIVGRNALIPRFIARYSPDFARVKNAADERRESIIRFRHTFFEGARDFFNLDVEQQNYLGELIDEQRRGGFQAKLNPTTGFLEFKRRDPDTGQVKTFLLKNPELARVYDQMQKVFKTIPITHKNQLRRSFAGMFLKANLGFDPTKQQFEAYKKALSENKVAKPNALTLSQIAEMEQYFSTLDSINKMLERDYVPHVRFGTRGSVLKDSSGKTIWFGTYNVDENGKPEQDSYDEYLSELNKFKNENSSRVAKQSDDFNLTLDGIMRQLGSNNKAMTLELLSQLMNSSNSKLFKEAMQEKLSPEELVKGKISNRGFLAHFAETEKENIQGYSKDWPRVISSYFNSAAYFLGNMENEPKLLVANSRLQNDSNTSPSLKKYSDNFVGSILDPEETYAGLRELQYFYAMGFNPASALLQFQSLFSYMPATLTLATNSHFQSIANLTKAVKIAPLFFNPGFNKKSKLHESLFAYGDSDVHEKLIKQGKITRQQSDAIKYVYNTGALQALRSGDMIGVPSDVSTRSVRSKWRQKLNDFVAASGIMMRTTEELTRGIQAIGAILSLESPDNVLRLHNNLMQNDALYRTKISESFSKQPDVNYLVQFLIDKALGEYGKESRSPLQNSGASVTVIPFSTYPTQMLLNTYEYIGGKYGKEGKKAALWAIASTGVMAGAFAIPAALFVKEMIELIIQQILGEERDLEDEFKKYAASQNMPDVLRRIATNGVFNEILGVDISNRMAVDVPFLTEFLKYLQGEQPMGIADLLGVQGSIATIFPTTLENAMQGQSPEKILAGLLPNVAAQNLIKGQINQEGTTFRGLPSMTPEQGSDPTNVIKRSLGFKPIEQGKGEDVISSAKREEQRYKIALDRFREPLKSTFKKELLAKTPKERQKVLSERSQLVQELVKFMQDKKIPNIGTSVRSTLDRARLEAFANLNGLESGAVRKLLKQSVRDDFDAIIRANQ